MTTEHGRPGEAGGHPALSDRITEDAAEELRLRELADRIVAEAAGNGAGSPSSATRPADEEPLPTISEQMSEQLGGWRGLVESSIPVLAFVLINMGWGLYPAIAGSVGTAVAIAIFRLVRRQPIRHAVNGLVGIAFGAYLAYRSGDAKDFYLPGIILSMGQGVGLLISAAVRRPIIGYVYAIVAAGGKHTWRDDPRMLYTFQWLTVLWAVSLFVRGGVQWALWEADLDHLLGVARVGLSWPIYLGMLALTVWAVRRATRQSAAAG